MPVSRKINTTISSSSSGPTFLLFQQQRPLPTTTLFIYFSLVFFSFFFPLCRRRRQQTENKRVEAPCTSGNRTNTPKKRQQRFVASLQQRWRLLLEAMICSQNFFLWSAAVQVRESAFTLWSESKTSPARQIRSCTWCLMFLRTGLCLQMRSPRMCE